jgi:hypothetical protein
MRAITLADFIGTWTLSRSLAHGDGTQARFEGQARFTPQGDGALYHEAGDLIMGQGRFHAERSYRWDADLRVFFDDGRFFHQVPDAGGEAAHWCDPDQYDVVYDFSQWPRWQAVWRVRGPRKDYTSTTDYAPLA